MSESISIGSLEPAGMNVASASAYTGISIDFLRNAMRAGDLKFLKFGKRHILLRSDLDDWLQMYRRRV